jgi:hypothetical protein
MNRNDLFKAGFELEENSKDELATLAEIVLQEVTRKDIQTTNLQSRMRDL